MSIVTLLLCVFLAVVVKLASALSSATGKGGQSKHLVILGLGHVGQALFDQAKPSSFFDSVRGTKRQPSSHDASVMTLEHMLPHLSTCTHLVVTIPPPYNMTSWVSQHLPSHTWIGVVSTTGVYEAAPDVTESSALLHTDAQAQLYLDYEQEWASLGRPTAVFRCAGLYGPTRSALHTVWNKGILMDDVVVDGMTNRIHEHDVARAILAAMTTSRVGVYNLADDEPERRSLVMKEAARLLRSIGREPPLRATTTQELSGGRRGERRSRGSKLVLNKKMKECLISALTYRTYREGLQAILKDENNPWWKVGENIETKTFNMD